MPRGGRRGPAPRVRHAGRARGSRAMTVTSPAVHTVVKVGGGLLGRAGALDLVVEALTAFRTGRRVVVLPGGGPFADAVRQMFKRISTHTHSPPAFQAPRWWTTRWGSPRPSRPDGFR
ncbi:MAG: hypothetical protein DMD34_11595 [Gemmatimonadetes bacterium]|nr:MAG: hypothetical protein DMD34_11595 [Gemmatimonadota bacterium]